MNGAPDFIETLHRCIRVLRDEIEEFHLVEDSGRSSLLAGTVVGEDHDQRVVEHPEFVECFDQPADLDVGVL